MIVEFERNKLQKTTDNTSNKEQENKILVFDAANKKRSDSEQKAIESILNRASRLNW